MKIQLSQPLKNLKGEDLKNEEGVLTLGIALSNILLSDKTGGKMKLWTLAQSCYQKDTLEVDASDLALLKKSVIATEIYTALVAGQCEELLEEVK